MYSGYNVVVLITITDTLLSFALEYNKGFLYHSSVELLNLTIDYQLV